MQALRGVTDKVQNSKDLSETLDHADIYNLKSALEKFEAVFGAELNLSPIYLVMKKRGYDVEELVAQGEGLFPDDLPNKVPEAIPDIQQATKCLAFELPTACGFHLHPATSLSFADTMMLFQQASSVQ